MDTIDEVLSELFNTNFVVGERVLMPLTKGYRAGEIITILAQGYCRVKWDSGADGFYEMGKLVRDTDFYKSLMP